MISKRFIKKSVYRNPLLANVLLRINLIKKITKYKLKFEVNNN